MLSEVRAPLILNLGTTRGVSGQLHSSAALSPRTVSSIPTEYEAAWVPEPVWPLQRRKSSLAVTGNRTTIPWLSSLR